MSQATSTELHTDPTQFPGVDVYAVAGHPISHSKSPAIHKRFAEQSNQKMHYGRLQPALDDFKTAAQSFFAAGGKGMNVTVPFKLDAQTLADVLTPRAQLAGAVNTLRIEDGKIFGKMGHSERYEKGLFQNIAGNKDQDIFANGVRYFTHKQVK